MTSKITRVRVEEAANPCSVAWPATRQTVSDSQARPNRATRRKQIPIAVASYSPAFGRLRWPRAIVRRCPVCSRGPLIHRVVNSALADGAVKTGSCGHRYRLRVRATLGVVQS